MGTNPKATIDTHRKRKKSPKHKSKDGHQTIREENRGREEKRLTKQIQNNALNVSKNIHVDNYLKH